MISHGRPHANCSRNLLPASVRLANPSVSLKHVQRVDQVIWRAVCFLLHVVCSRGLSAVAYFLVDQPGR